MNDRSVRQETFFATVVMVALVAVLFLVPGHYRVLPEFSEVAIGAALIVFLWTRLAAYAVAVFALIVVGIEVTILARLLQDMAARPSTLDANILLWTAIELWLVNAVVFTLVYWQLDRGGPSGRAQSWQGRADFHFPRGEGADGVPADWQPSFTDYLYLSVTTSAAFSPSEIYPLTNRAKLLHLVQSLISLLTIVAVAARAIDVLGK